ncbi:unnamed protein product [Staurois parvus]|uniref:Uncharacterized protein n=1 Tax=Staurois parvus TaxID=386267 RepID=A0ABN9CQS8_9NEOB|nr:unnamed protein product [Staurois parvus]
MSVILDKWCMLHALSVSTTSPHGSLWTSLLLCPLIFSMHSTSQ